MQVAVSHMTAVYNCSLIVQISLFHVAARSFINFRLTLDSLHRREIDDPCLTGSQTTHKSMHGPVIKHVLNKRKEHCLVNCKLANPERSQAPSALCSDLSTVQCKDN